MFSKNKFSLKIIFFYITYITIIAVSLFILLELGIRLQIVFFDKDLSDQLQKANYEIPPPIVNNCAIPRQEQATLGAIVKPSIYPDIVYELKPNIKTCFYDNPVWTNASGLRANKDYKKPKPENVYRILILGDSQGFGLGVSYEETFGYYLEKKLKDIILNKEIEVINTSVPGYNTAMEAAYLKEYGMKYEPDCIFILFVDNDLGLPWLMKKNRNILTIKELYIFDFVKRFENIYYSNKDWFQTAPDLFRDDVAEKDRRKVPKEYRHMVGVLGYKKALKSIVNLVGSRKVPIINLLRKDTFSNQENPNELADYQEKLGIITPSFELPQTIEYTISEEDLHLNPNGHREVGRQVLEIFIRNVLNESLYNASLDVDSYIESF